MDFADFSAYFYQYPEIIWLVVAMALFVLEVTAAPGVGLLFGAIAGLTLGGILSFGVIETPDFYIQITYFFGFTIMWALLLWKPIKKYMYSNTGTYDLYRGTTATVAKNSLKKGKTGVVRWSGTNMRARIHTDSTENIIPIDEEVYIHDLQNGVVFVSTSPINEK